MQQVWNQFRTLLLVLIPSFFVQGMANSYQEHAFYDSLGRMAFMIGALWLLLFFARLNRERLPLTWGQSDMTKPHLLHHFIWNSLMLAPLLAVIGALFGYFYTSRILLRQLELSLLMGLGCLLVYYLARRWMLIQRRRLAFERAKSKRAEILAQRGRDDNQEELSSEIPDVVEETELDLDTISAQSLGLVRTLLMLGFTMLVVVQWSDLNSAFSFLSNIEVWQVSSKIGGIEQLSAITLQDLMLTAFVFILTVVTARNLPGLMELTLLQHLSLSPGTGFALTTTSKYLVILIGALTGFSMLGIDWSKTQWLVAALSVGLGFGLQEIFANFVSGLIILFEKPIRLGDTVTIRDLTGTVTKIKTRATTIVDWDCKEIIVPNKAFITEQFINWSLSDAITRVKLRIRIGLTQEFETGTAHSGRVHPGIDPGAGDADARGLPDRIYRLGADLRDPPLRQQHGSPDAHHSRGSLAGAGEDAAAGTYPAPSTDRHSPEPRLTREVKGAEHADYCPSWCQRSGTGKHPQGDGQSAGAGSASHRD